MGHEYKPKGTAVNVLMDKHEIIKPGTLVYESPGSDVVVGRVVHVCPSKEDPDKLTVVTDIYDPKVADKIISGQTPKFTSMSFVGENDADPV
jgi:hypothetical protein